MNQNAATNIAVRLLAILAALMFCAVSSAQTQQSELNRLNKETTTLYQQGQYAQAMVIARKALRVSENLFPPTHPDVALRFYIIASLHLAQGQYAEAESFFKRSLTIWEKALGPDHSYVAMNLNNLASLYSKQGQYAQAELNLKRSLAIKEKTLGPDDPEVAVGLHNLGTLYVGQGNFTQAGQLYKRALAIQEKSIGPNHPDVAQSLTSLALLHDKQGQFAQAELLFKRALAIQENALGSDHPFFASILDHLAGMYVHQGRYMQAESVLKRALAIQERSLGPEHPHVATSLTYLADVYLLQGQYAQAEPILKRALAIQEKSLGFDHSDVAGSLNRLASLYLNQDKYARAEPLIKRAIAILEKALGPDHSAVGTTLNTLGALYARQKQYGLAEPIFKRSLAIQEKSLGPDHPEVALSLGNLAVQYAEQENYAQAEPLYKRSLAIREKVLGPDNPDAANSLYNLAELYVKQGDYTQAGPLMKQSLAIRESVFGPDSRAVASSLEGLVNIYDRQGQYVEALSLMRKATAIYRKRVVGGGIGDAAVSEAAMNRGALFHHLAILAVNPGHESPDKVADEAFQVVQLAQASGTASAIVKMAARFAKGDDELAGLIRRKQDGVDRVIKQETQLVTTSSKPPQQRDAANEQTLRDQIALDGKEILTIDAELTLRFPQYQELTRPEPVTVSQVRALLKPGEAMLVYALGSSSFVWVVRPDGANFMQLQLDVKEIATKVAAVRAEMDFDSKGAPFRVSVGSLHELYQSVFTPVLPYLAGVSHVIVVSAGPLQSLPLGMLVASRPLDIRGDADYRQVDWLATHYSLSVLPSVSSIQAFRQLARQGSPRQPFAGFGDPLIGEQSGTMRGKRAKIDIAGVFRSLLTAANNKTSITQQSAEIADVESIRLAPRLPETADELRAMAKVLKADTKSIWLRENATETNVKRLDLSQYRTIAFATHGVMAGELKGVGEPGLILTPPRQGSVEDDGYLSASEIAKLKLNADWVVLSACNTAAADGTPGAEGLSGLAKAFFYAGARSLLVSHWRVDSDATVPLTTGMLKEYESNPAQGKAEAQRKAMMALMNTPDHPEYAHPLFWAPFVVVGEGGAGSH